MIERESVLGMNTEANILVVDDEPNLRRSLELIFKWAGYSVATAANGIEALHHLKKDSCDLVLLDLKMPGMNGKDLLRSILHLCPETPVMILTAIAQQETKLEGLSKEAHEYILKPVDPPQLLARVKDVLAKQARFNHWEKMAAPARYLQRGMINIDLHSRQVVIGNQFISLLPVAFNYLVTLALYAPETVPYETLACESLEHCESPSQARQLVRRRICELRRAIEPDPRHPVYIRIVRGVGYRLAVLSPTHLGG
jgi:two-component system, OmpR family, alkaline phosphatase synthesis response regulator PhoP